MALFSSSSRSELLKEYHRIAADALLGAPNTLDENVQLVMEHNYDPALVLKKYTIHDRSDKVAVAILQAAENGQVERLQKLLGEHKELVDSHHPDSGDTPLISAARRGHREVVDVLLSSGADVTLQNDSGESVLEVAGGGLRSHILQSISHEDRSMSNAKALLQSAWLGDAVTLRRCLSGSHYLDVNNSNSDGLTPLLLVTRDVSFFSKVQTAMETEYNPLDVLEHLLNNYADVNQSDRYGRGPLHLIASAGPSIHATKMVSLLLQHGSTTDTLSSSSSQSPLHVASSQGHMTVIVALVEEGGADVNLQTTETGDTPLILSVRGGYNEAARYLLSKGADVAMVNEGGDSALSVANSPRMNRMIKEAWTEQTEHPAMATTTPGTDNERGSPVTSPLSPGQPHTRSFFLTDRRMSRSLDLEEQQLVGPNDRGSGYSGGSSPAPDSPVGAEKKGSHDRSHEKVGEGGVSEGEGRAMRERKGERVKSKMKRRVQSETGLVGQHPESRASGRNLLAGQPVGKGERYFSQPQLKTEEPRTGGGRETNAKKKTMKAANRNKSSSRLLTQTKRESHDGHVIRNRESHDSHVSGRGQQTRGPGREQLLPEVYTFFSPPSAMPPSNQSRHNDRKLPPINLKGMKAVAMVAVDTKQDNLRVRQMPKTGNAPLQRSRSLMAPASKEKPLLSRSPKRNSTGSIYQFSPHDNNKATLQPRVVAPQLTLTPSHLTLHPPHHLSLPTSHHHPSHPTAQRRPQLAQPTPSLQSQGNRININFQTPQQVPPAPQAPPLQPSLSTVEELSESMASSTHLGSEVNHTHLDPTQLRSEVSRTPSTPGSEGSTLKASSQSDFETDSLERRRTPVQAIPLASHAPSSANLLSPLSPSSGLPPTFDQFRQLTRHPSTASTSPSSNTVTHYAVVNGSVSLSPIWNQDQPQSGSSSSSEYITSVMSALASAGHRSTTRAPGRDSGHSTDDERLEEEEGEEGESDGSSSEEEPAETRCLQWKRGRLLGKGAFGKVWEGLLDSGKMIAVKEVELDIAGQRAQSQYVKLRLEVEILRSVRHVNVVRYLGTSMDECKVYIFMELITGGSLLSIIKRYGQLNDKLSSHYTRQMVHGLNYLHSNGIVHRDVKGANVMVTTKGVVKLVDFGSAKQEVAGDMMSVRGTPYWMAPEVIRGEGYGRKSDIWSLGCTVHEMTTSKPPWAEHPPEAAIFQIGSSATIPPLPDYLSPGVISFITQCVVKDQIERPGAEQLLDHTFLTKFRKRTKS